MTASYIVVHKPGEFTSPKEKHGEMDLCSNNYLEWAIVEEKYSRDLVHGDNELSSNVFTTSYSNQKYLYLFKIPGSHCYHVEIFKRLQKFRHQIGNPGMDFDKNMIFFLTNKPLEDFNHETEHFVNSKGEDISDEQMGGYVTHAKLH